MPNEANIHMKGQGTRAFLENVSIAWKAKFPQQSKEYRKVLEENINGLVNVAGMSKKGKLKYTGAIPADVFYVIESKYPRFFQDPKNMRIFQEIFMGNLVSERDSGKFFYQGASKK
jgi:hypothetical protein